MYFLFFIYKIKYGVAGLDIVDRQNAHSMTLVVRSFIKLFWFAKHKDEVYQKILAFSIFHDTTIVRIYGYYPLIDGKNTTYFYHFLRLHDIIDQKGKEK